jgi:hypothetical protein
MLPTGNVEVWLGEVECRMKSSVRTQVTAGPEGFGSPEAHAMMNRVCIKVVCVCSELLHDKLLMRHCRKNLLVAAPTELFLLWLAVASLCRRSLQPCMPTPPGRALRGCVSGQPWWCWLSARSSGQGVLKRP